MAGIIVTIVIYFLMLISLRGDLLLDLRLISHKRLFRHSPKNKISFVGRFLLLHYVKYFKEKWMFHYVLFSAYIIVGFFTILLSIAQTIWSENECLKTIFVGIFIVSLVIGGIPTIFGTRYNRKGHSIRRKKQ